MYATLSALRRPRLRLLRRRLRPGRAAGGVRLRRLHQLSRHRDDGERSPAVPFAARRPPCCDVGTVSGAAQLVRRRPSRRGLDLIRRSRRMSDRPTRSRRPTPRTGGRCRRGRRGRSTAPEACPSRPSARGGRRRRDAPPPPRRVRRCRPAAAPRLRRRAAARSVFPTASRARRRRPAGLGQVALAAALLAGARRPGRTPLLRRQDRHRRAMLLTCGGLAIWSLIDLADPAGARPRQAVAASSWCRSPGPDPARRPGRRPARVADARLAAPT